MDFLKSKGSVIITDLGAVWMGRASRTRVCLNRLIFKESVFSYENIPLSMHF